MEIIIQETAKLKNPYRDGVIPITETVIKYDSSTAIFEYPHVIRIGLTYPRHYYGRLTVLTNSGHLLNSYESSSRDLVAIGEIALDSNKLYQFYREPDTQVLVLAILTPSDWDKDKDVLIYSAEEYYVRGSLSSLQFGISISRGEGVSIDKDVIPYYNDHQHLVNVNIGGREYNGVGELSREVTRNFNFHRTERHEEITHIYGMFYLKESNNG